MNVRLNLLAAAACFTAGIAADRWLLLLAASCFLLAALFAKGGTR